MHKTPKEIARALRTFRNAHRLGLLHSIRVSPGRDACEAAQLQNGVEYPWNLVPALPLPQCTCDLCECKYLSTGTAQLCRLNAIGKPSPNLDS